MQRIAEADILTPNLARELKKLWNMEVIVIPIVIDAPGTVIKALAEGLEDLEIGRQVETIQLQHCWDRPEYWEESWRLKKTCYNSDSGGKSSVNAGTKNSQWINKNHK